MLFIDKLIIQQEDMKSCFLSKLIAKDVLFEFFFYEIKVEKYVKNTLKKRNSSQTSIMRVVVHDTKTFFPQYSQFDWRKSHFGSLSLNDCFTDYRKLFIKQVALISTKFWSWFRGKFKIVSSFFFSLDCPVFSHKKALHITMWNFSEALKGNLLNSMSLNYSALSPETFRIKNWSSINNHVYIIQDMSQ